MEKESSPFLVIKELEKQWFENYKATIAALSKAFVFELKKIEKGLKK